jgi:BASS family bile acid:Na+ symporter
MATTRLEAPPHVSTLIRCGVGRYRSAVATIRAATHAPIATPRRLALALHERRSIVLAAFVAFLFRNVMSALMLAVGLDTTAAALRATWSQRAVVGRALAALAIAVPLLGLIVAAAMPLPVRATACIAIMAACPGAPVALRRGRDRALATTIIAAVSLLAPLIVSVWVGAIDRTLGFDFAVAPATLATVALRQLLPLALGIAVASAWPRVAHVLGRVAWVAFYVAFGIAIAVAIVKGAPEFLAVNLWELAAVVAMVAGSIAIGHLAGAPDREHGQLVATIAVLGNPALAIAVVTESYPGYRPGALFLAYLLLRGLLLVPYSVWATRSRGHGGGVVSRCPAPAMRRTR